MEILAKNLKNSKTLKISDNSVKEVSKKLKSQKTDTNLVMKEETKNSIDEEEL